MDPLYFRATLDTMTPLMLRALIDIAEGKIVSVWWSDKEWPYPALIERDLIGAEVAVLMYYSELIGIERPYETTLYQLTAYGRAFLAWYRQPREVSGQLKLWE